VESSVDVVIIKIKMEKKFGAGGVKPHPLTNIPISQLTRLVTTSAAHSFLSYLFLMIWQLADIKNKLF